MAANLALAGCLGWKWSIWPVPTWLAVQRYKYIFFLTLYDSINYIKFFWSVCITHQPCHSHFCCCWLPIWPKLYVCAENGSYGLCQCGCRYNVAKMYFSWPEMIVSIIRDTSKLSASHLSRATAMFVVDCFQFGPRWMFGLKMEFIACADLVGGTSEQSSLFTDLIWYYQWYEILQN